MSNIGNAIENKTIKYFRNMMLNIKTKMVIRYLKAKLSDEAVSAIIEYMIQARDFLNDELKQIGEAI